MATQVDEYRRLKQKYLGEVIHPEIITIATFDPKGPSKTFVSSSTAAVRVLDQAGNEVKSFPASHGGLSFFLIYQDGWKVTEIKATA